MGIERFQHVSGLPERVVSVNGVLMTDSGEFTEKVKPEVIIDFQRFWIKVRMIISVGRRND